MLTKKIKILVGTLEDAGLPRRWKKDLTQEKVWALGFMEKILVSELGLPIDLIDKGDISGKLTDKDKEEIAANARLNPMAGHKQLHSDTLLDIVRPHVKECKEEYSLDERFFVITGYDLFADKYNFLWATTGFGGSVFSAIRHFFHPINVIGVSYRDRIAYECLAPVGMLLDAGYSDCRSGKIKCVTKYCISTHELDELILNLKLDPFRKRVPFCEKCQEEMKKHVEYFLQKAEQQQP